MFYQWQNSLNADALKLETGFDFQFPAHLHSSFEFIAVTEGEMIVTVDGCPYTLRSDNALLIFPNQVHDFFTPTHSRHFLCIFSPTLVQAYSPVFLSKVPRCNAFTPDPFYVRQLMNLCEQDSILKIKGILYALCGTFDANAEYENGQKDRHALLSDIFRFVAQNYNKDCSLAALSAATSYHYVYLSKYFSRCTGSSFSDYVTRYRINEACYLLQNTEHGILKIAFDCGFDALRSFNRNFKRIIGMTPREYRTKLHQEISR